MRQQRNKRTQQGGQGTGRRGGGSKRRQKYVDGVQGEPKRALAFRGLCDVVSARAGSAEGLGSERSAKAASVAGRDAP